MKGKPGIIWHQAARQTAKRAKYRRTAEKGFSADQQLVLETLSEKFEGLYLGLQEATLSKEAINSLTEVFRSKVTKDTYDERADFFNAGVELGRDKLNWDVPYLPLTFKISREQSLLTPDIFHFTQQAGSLIDAFTKQLSSDLTADPEALLEKILFSAVMFGGLLESCWHRPFLEALNKKEIYQEGNLLWVEMSLADKPRRGTAIDDNQTYTQNKRWVADCLSQLLIYKFVEQPIDLKKVPEPWDLLKRHLNRLSIGPEAPIPLTYKELIQWAFSRSQPLLPANILGYANGSLPAASLPIGPWLRIITESAIPIKKPKGEKTDKKIREKKIIENPLSGGVSQNALLSELKKCLTTKSRDGQLSTRSARRKIIAFQKSSKGYMSPTLQLITYWALQLLNTRESMNEHRQALPLKARSVLRYLNEVGDPLLRSFGTENPLKLAPVDFETLLDGAAARKKYDRYSIGRLAQFHGFLKTFYSKHRIPEVSWGSLYIGKNGKVQPNANLISQHTYDLALKSFNWGSEVSRWNQLYIIALILLFRFGLRPSELRSLLITDIQGITKHEILIRTSKTKAGTRRIPLNIFLSDEELQYILCYHRQRKQEMSLYGGDLFFAHPSQKSGLLSDEDLFGPIRKVLRQITQDETLRLYHTRHSFLTWLQTSFFLRGDDLQCDNLAVNHDFFSSEKRQEIETALMANENHGRKSQYQLALLAGHNSPKTTHHHYIHLSDWLLGYYLRRQENSIKISHRAMSNVTGLKRSRAFDLLNEKSDKHSLLSAVEARGPHFSEALRHPLMAEARPLSSVATDSTNSPLPFWEDALESFYQTTNPTKLPRDKEWGLAANIYEVIRKLDGRRLRTARKVIISATENFSDRWGGFTYDKYEDLRKMCDFLETCSISKERILLIHHSLRGQNIKTSSKYLQRWTSEAKIPSDQTIPGEKANLKYGPKGCVTLRITSGEKQLGKARTSKTSPGLTFALNILSKTIQRLNT